MKYFSWNNNKNEKLKQQRDVSFEEIIYQIQNDGLVEILDYPNEEIYKGQRIFVVVFRKYIYLVPFIENEKEIFLKTIIPSRKFTKMYLGEQK
jgi:uncharacterized DUF497 family protein